MAELSKKHLLVQAVRDSSCPVISKTVLAALPGWLLLLANSLGAQRMIAVKFSSM